MKKIAYAAATLATMLIAACSGNTSEKQTTTPGSDSTSISCNIRYIDVDSVLSGYVLAQELFAEQQKEVTALENVARQKDSDLQRRQAQIENKARNNGYLTQESFNTDMNELQQRQNEAGQWLNANQERLARLMATQQQRLNDSIQSFLKDYNEVYKYDAILDKKAGFFNPDLDITNEIIQGLNDRYTSEAK